MVSFKLEQGAKISPEEKRMLEKAKALPVVFDEDSPELTEEMERKFIEARRKKPYSIEAPYGVEPLTIYVSSVTIEKAKMIGKDYMEVLGRLLDQAVNEYMAV